MLWSRPEDHSLRYDLIFPLLSRLPPPLAYRLADWQSLYFAHQQKPQSDLIATQMHAAFPAASTPQVQQWVAEYFRMVEREALDTWFLDQAILPDLVALEGFEQVVDLRKAGQRVLLTGAHYGRFWMAGPAMRQQGHRVGTITRDGGQVNAHGLHPAEYRYRLFKLAKLAKILGGPFLVEGADLRPLYRELDSSLMTLVFDVPYLKKPAGSVTVPFLRGNINLPAGIFRIAKKTEAVVVPFYMRDLGAGQVVAEFSEVLDPNKYNKEGFMSLLAAQLEMRIKKHPGQWWLWEALPLLWSDN